MPPESSSAELIRDPLAWARFMASDRTAARVPATARAVFMVSPDGFSLAAESATDNVYMASGAVDVQRALQQHAAMANAIAMSLPVQVFSGNAEAPDGVFPNNVFATVPGKLIVGAMRHPVRQREAQRGDLPAWFVEHHGYRIEAIDRRHAIAELTGVLIIDHARNVGYCGISERVDAAGISALQTAFGLRAMFAFDLMPGEYHTNVVMSVLAGRALVIHAGSFADPRVPMAIAAAYGSHVVWLSDAEKAAFAGNCIALADDEVWMSARAAAALTPDHRAQLTNAGFAVRSVDISEIEKAGGSLRCCVGEIW